MTRRSTGLWTRASQALGNRSAASPFGARLRFSSAALLPLSLCLACTADLGMNPGDPNNPNNPNPGVGGGGTVIPGAGGGSSVDPGAGGTGGGTDAPLTCAPRFKQDLILLGELPFVNSLRDLFGANAIEGRLAPDVTTKPFSQKGLVANTSLVGGRLDWASHVAESIADRVQEFTGCAGGDNACARQFVERFAHRAYRRPVDPAEINDLMTVFDGGAVTSFQFGIQLVVQAILVSPSFNHRTEYGERAADGSYPLTPHEFASTLSFLLTDSLPDDELLNAADSGALDTLEERETQALRMLSVESTKESVESTLLAAWTLGNIFGKVKDPTLYPEYSGALASQMYEETRLYLRKHLWSGGLTNVLSSQTTFVNQALADLYGIPFPGDNPNAFVEVQLPGNTRAGLLTQASVLTALSRTDETSVVARGLFVNGPLLCMPKIPSPPQSAIAIIEEQLHSDTTERERADFRAITSPCNNCHDQFDAYGLLFETYDAIGQHRTVDERGDTIDPSVDLSKMLAFDETFGNAVEFANALAARPEFVECVTRHMIAYGTGEDGLQRSDCEVKQLTAKLSSTSTLADVVKAVVGSTALSTRISE